MAPLPELPTRDLRLLAVSVLSTTFLFVVANKTNAALGSKPEVGKKMAFAGKVREVDARSQSFVMNGGASKRYAVIQVTIDKKTVFTGMKRPTRRVEVGDPLRVDVVPLGEMRFRAVSIEIQDRNARPGSATFGSR